MPKKSKTSPILEEVAAPVAPPTVTDPGLQIDHPEKIGIGTWDYNSQGSALFDVEDMGFGWYYDWQTKPLWDNPHDATTPQVDFVPITWGTRRPAAASNTSRRPPRSQRVFRKLGRQKFFRASPSASMHRASSPPAAS